MTTRQQIDGIGAVFVDDSGRVRIVVSDACGEAFDAASAMGITADELVNTLLAQAEAGRLAVDSVIDEPREDHVMEFSTDTRAVRCERPMRPELNRCERSKRPRHRERWQKRYS